MKKLLNPNHILLFCILILAAYLRLYKIEGYMTFLGDEGRDALVIYNILHGKLTLLGPTASVGGFFMGPIYYYLVAPFYWLFGYSPVGASVFVALLSVATVFLVWKISKEFFGTSAGIVASFLYATSPLVITYSHSSWNPNVMPFFTLLTLYILYKAVRSKNSWLFILVGILYGIDIQLHYTELFVGLIIMLYVLLTEIWRQGRRISFSEVFETLKKGIWIFGGFLIGFSPFLAFEVRHEFPNTKSIISFIFGSPDTGGDNRFLYTVFDVFFRIFERLIVSFPVPNFQKGYSQIILTLWYTGGQLVALIAVGLLVYQFYKVIKEKKDSFYYYLLICLWLFLGIILFGFYKKQIYDYYFEFLFPVPFLIFGNAFSYFWQKKTVYKLVLSATLFLIILANYSTSPLRLPANYQFNQAKEIADFVLEKTDGKPFNFALITGGNSDHAYRYFFKLAGREPVVIQNSVIDPNRKSVTGQLLVVCDTLPCSPLGHPLWEIAGFGRAQVAGQWDVTVIKVFKLIHYQEAKK
ncbi:MAG: glycosyltransferase family 39 protein [Candidatus Levybacteria bacterium]|nr:glycosyltransferase family 39 protein [Candidatus Levybacteria bacterium]